MEEKSEDYLLTDSLSSFSSMTGSFWILFLLRFAEGVFGNKLILLTGLEKNRDYLGSHLIQLYLFDI